MSGDETCRPRPRWQRLGIMDLILLVAVFAIAFWIAKRLPNVFDGFRHVIFTLCETTASVLFVGAPVIALKQIALGRREPPTPGEKLWFLQSVFYAVLFGLMMILPDEPMILPTFMVPQIILSVLVLMGTLDVLVDGRFRTKLWTDWVGIGFASLPGILALALAFV